MKKRNKFLALLLAATLSISVSACGSQDAGSGTASGTGNASQEETSQGDDKDSGKDASAALATATENMNGVKSMNAKMEVNFDMEAQADGESQSMSTATTIDMSCFYDPLLIKADLKVDAGELGSTTATSYIEADDSGKYTVYTNDGTNWQSQSVELTAVEQYNAAENMKQYMSDSYHFEPDGTEEVNGANAFKFKGAITGDDMKDAILSSGALNSLASLGMDASQAESMMKDISEIPIILWIDEAELYPVKYEVDMTDAMNTLMSNMIEALGEDMQGATIKIPKMEMTMTCSDFNSVEEFSIPEEAKQTEPAA